jgi:hypothetical protein
MSEKARILTQKLKRRIHYRPYQNASEITPLFSRDSIIEAEIKSINDCKGFPLMNLEISEPFVKLSEIEEIHATNPWKVPTDAIFLVYLLRWPITFTLWCTIPDSKRFQKLFLLTFINSVLWIGCISYFIVYLSTNLGKIEVTHYSIKALRI